MTVAATAAGVWVGIPDVRALRRRPEPTRARWIWTVLAFSAAGVFTALWDRLEPLRDHPLGGAVAVLLVLAEPAYAAGILITALQWREQPSPGRPNRIAVAMLLGIAAGIIAATSVLIPNVDPPGIYLGSATLLAIFGAIEATRSASTPIAELEMQGRAVLITGVGDRGQVGFALARRFLDAGARVLITSRSDPAPLVTELAAYGETYGAAADLTSTADVERLIATARERLGGLDALVHAAGGLRAIGPVAETDEEMWRAEIENNTTTAFLLIRAALPLLRERRGAIVAFASPAGERAVANLAAYSVAKAGIVALARAVALEEKHTGVRVNAIAPGTIDTASNRASAEEGATFVTREEVAEVALFLASPAAAGINGQTIHVPGPTLS